jgi:hypothetical protein
MRPATFDVGGAIRALSCDLAAAEAEIAGLAGAGAGALPSGQSAGSGEPALLVDRVEVDFPVYFGLDAAARPVATAPRRNIVFARTAFLGRVRVVLVREEKPKTTP